MSIIVPYNRPAIVGRELEYVAEAVRLGNTAGDGPFTRRCQQFLERRYGIPAVIMTTSGTSALDVAARAIGLGPGDEAIVPTYTFVATANAVAQTGARPVLVDIRRDTLNLDERLLEQAITPRTKAIFPVHYAGVGCDMEAINAIARAHNLVVVEDAAQGVEAFYRDRPLGTLGHLAAYSFHEQKNLSGGQVGAICINDLAYRERIEIIRDKGTNRAKFQRGEIDHYSWVDVGAGHTPSEICTAFLTAQLEQIDEIGRRRRAIDQRYHEALAPLASRGLLEIPRPPADCRWNNHLFLVLLPDRARRDAFIAHMLKNTIGAPFHYIPLHTTPMGRGLGYAPGDLPVAEELAGRLARLPIYYDLSPAHQTYVIEQTRQFFLSAS